MAIPWAHVCLSVWWQLFWEKKLSGLNAFDIAEELVKTMDLPKGLQGNPGPQGGWEYPFPPALDQRGSCLVPGQHQLPSLHSWACRWPLSSSTAQLGARWRLDQQDVSVLGVPKRLRV